MSVYVQGEPVSIRLEKAHRDELEAYRIEHGLRSRNMAVRHIIEQMIAARLARSSRPPAPPSERIVRGVTFPFVPIASPVDDQD